MTVVDKIQTFFTKYMSSISFPDVQAVDVIEVLIIAFLIYEIMVWIRNTRAWVLFKGILVLFGFVLVAALLQMNTILWIAEKTVSVGIIALVIIFQPELRKALESLGTKKFFSVFSILGLQKTELERYSDHTIQELVKACFAMGKVKTGALIVVEKDIVLAEFERTGINVDASISNQLLINIFEHNTPLHDGAVLVRGDRVVAATCYLPLSDNLDISKELGTRHRAAVGASEVNDSLTIVVSEETGKVSVAENGVLSRDLTPDELEKRLRANQKRLSDANHLSKWKRRFDENVEENSENADQ